MNTDRARLIAEADIYRLLSLSYAYPDRETTESLRCLIRDIEGVVHGFPFDIQEEFVAYKGSIEGMSSRSLEEEYTELFMTRMLCPPYETSYGSNGFNKAGTLSDISGFYRAFGLSVTDTGSDMHDHIAIETEFLSLLAIKEAYGVEKGFEDMVEVSTSAKRKFLSDHLARWAGTFCRKLVEKTVMNHYRNLALLTARFIEDEIRYYDITVEPVEGLLQETAGPLVCPVGAGSEGHDWLRDKSEES